MSGLDALKRRARALRAETLALALAARHPRTPWYARVLVAAVVAYALSPIDLIPDFVPVLGYLDDLVLIPLGIWLAIKLIPPAVFVECRARAQSALASGAAGGRAAAAVIVAVWLAAAALAGLWIYEAVRP